MNEPQVTMHAKKPAAKKAAAKVEPVEQEAPPKAKAPKQKTPDPRWGYDPKRWGNARAN